jgi:hypothetical protein
LNMSRFSFPDAPGDLIGAHISTKGGLHTVFERAAAIEASALALFAKNSNQMCSSLSRAQRGISGGAARKPRFVAAPPLIPLSLRSLGINFEHVPLLLLRCSR